jgi:inosose dehydratase
MSAGAATRVQQRFTFGYHLNSWDLAGEPLDAALQFLAESGFGWFEALTGDSLSTDFARRHMTLGDLAPPAVVTDAAWLDRLALFSRAQIEHGIRLSSLYANVELVNPLLWPAERTMLEGLARVLKGFDAPVLVLGGGPAETAHRPQTDEDFVRFTDGLAEIGRYTQALGIDTVYHPHMDTFVERRDQLDRVMDRLDTEVVGLCIDPAHLVHFDADPVDAVRTYGAAIRYMHFKDTHVGPELHGHARYGAFCELGAGVVDLRGLTDALLEIDYDGLVIVELDASEKPAEQCARESIAYLTDTLGLQLTPGSGA